MKNLGKLLKGHKYIVFMDFEGTQYSHEMIAIGATVAYLDRKNRIKKLKESFKIFVKAKNKIGKYVVDLTGIQEKTLQEQGVSFYKAMEEFKKYCGRNFTKSSFVTFGSHDLTILNSSVSYNLSYPKDVVSVIQKNYFDFTILLNEFVRDEKNNPLSLVNACKLFGCEVEGIPHDPVFDAVSLAKLYDAFIQKKDILLNEYLHVLKFGQNLPQAVRSAIKKLASGEDVSAYEFEQNCKDYIDD